MIRKKNTPLTLSPIVKGFVWYKLLSATDLLSLRRLYCPYVLSFLDSMDSMHSLLFIWTWKAEREKKFAELQSRVSFCLSSKSSQLVFLKYPSTRNSCMTSWWGNALPRARIVALPGLAFVVKPPCTICSYPMFSLLEECRYTC